MIAVVDQSFSVFNSAVFLDVFILNVVIMNCKTGIKYLPVYWDESNAHGSPGTGKIINLSNVTCNILPCSVHVAVQWETLRK